MAGLCYKTSQWSDTLLERYRKSSAPLQRILDAGCEEQTAYPKFAQDVHARLYLANEPEQRDTPPGCEWAESLHAEADKLPEWQRLKARCQRSPFAAGIATESVLRATLAHVPKQEKKKKPQADGQGPPQQNDDGQARRDMRNAAKQAAAQVDSAEQAVEPFADALGINAGNDPSKPQTDDDHSALLALYEAIRDSPDLADIAELAGRIRNSARVKKRSQITRGIGDIVGIAPGERSILPQEIAGLRDGRMTRLLTLRKILARQALGYKHRPDPAGLTHGPFVVLLDVSGSMGGSRLPSAKALALALMTCAARQRRTFACLTFNQAVQYSALFPRGKRPDINTLLDLLNQHAHGGTSFDVALNAAADIVEGEPGFSSADIFMITDGEGREHEETTQRLQAINGLNLYVLGIGAPCTVLRELATEIWQVSHIGADTGADLASVINP